MGECKIFQCHHLGRKIEYQIFAFADDQVLYTDLTDMFFIFSYGVGIEAGKHLILLFLKVVQYLKLFGRFGLCDTSFPLTDGRRIQSTEECIIKEV